MVTCAPVKGGVEEPRSGYGKVALRAGTCRKELDVL